MIHQTNSVFMCFWTRRTRFLVKSTLLTSCCFLSCCSTKIQNRSPFLAFLPQHQKNTSEPCRKQARGASWQQDGGFAGCSECSMLNLWRFSGVLGWSTAMAVVVLIYGSRIAISLNAFHFRTIYCLRIFYLGDLASFIPSFNLSFLRLRL